MAAKSCANSDQKMVDDAASLISTEVDWMLDDVTVECIAQNSVEVVHDIYQPAVELNGKDHIGSCYEEVQQLRVDDSHGAHKSKHCDAIANDLEMCQDSKDTDNSAHRTQHTDAMRATNFLQNMWNACPISGNFAYVAVVFGKKASYCIDALVLGETLVFHGTRHKLVLLHTRDVPHQWRDSLKKV